jgi:hypothetical protein
VVANDYDDLQSGVFLERPLTADEALATLERARGSRYDPGVVAALRDVVTRRSVRHVEVPREVSCRVAGLRHGDVVARDILGRDGLLLLAAGHQLNERLIDLLRAYELRENESLSVYVHRKEKACAAA